jgi:hypothetical protein
MVHLQKLHERFAKDGLLEFAVAMLSDRDEVRALDKELGITFPVFFGYGSDLGKHYSFG